MSLSRHSIEILLDLIEIKVSTLQVQDRDDARELTKLRKCRQELLVEGTQAALEKIENQLKTTRSARPRRERRVYYSR